MHREGLTFWRPCSARMTIQNKCKLPPPPHPPVDETLLGQPHLCPVSTYPIFSSLITTNKSRQTLPMHACSLVGNSLVPSLSFFAWREVQFKSLDLKAKLAIALFPLPPYSTPPCKYDLFSTTRIYTISYCSQSSTD